ncbi:ABC transporter substrate-binding protein [Phyllobacterium sp. 22229]|uniref:ABC transporter substrate-binding protein n=1 Tax=Phyllobacterium sp. 22229 TaxID=3453895 RepID=UPI003F8652AB
MKLLKATTLALLLTTSCAFADTEITYQFWGSPQEVGVWNSVARAFETEHPGIKVKIEASDWDSYWEKLKVKVAGGTPPDVFAMDAPLYKDWQSRGVLLNLKPYLDKEPGILDGVYPLTLKAYETPDGFYGLPRDFQTIVLYYNKDMFDAAGVAYPNDGWTWEDFRTAAKKLTKDKDGDGKTDQWGFWEAGYDMEPFWGALVWSFGGEVVNPETHKTLISSPQAMAAFQFMSDMWLKDKSMPSEQQLRQYGADGFFAGISAMGVSGHWSVPEYSQVAFKWDIAPLPKGPAGRVTSANSAGFVIAKDSKHPNEAWEFVKYAFGEKGQTELAKIGLAIPVRKSIAERPAYLDQSTKIDHSLYVKALDYAHLKPVFKGYEEWSGAVGDALHMAWTGEMKITDALAEAVANGDEVLARSK